MCNEQTEVEPCLECPICHEMTDHYTVSSWIDRHGEARYGTMCPTCPNGHVLITPDMLRRSQEIVR